MTATSLPVLLMEPTSQVKRRHYSDVVRDPGRALRPTREDTTRRLKELRSYAVAHIDEMVASLTARLAACSTVTFSFAPDAGRAVEIIRGVAGGRMIAVNRAAVIENELKKGLILSGCSIVDSYEECLWASSDNSSDDMLNLRP